MKHSPSITVITLLWQVHLGEGSDEYRQPVEFFRRTFLTVGLTDLLANALTRLSGNGGDPVVEPPDQFRRWQDALDAGALSPVLRAAQQQYAYQPAFDFSASYALLRPKSAIP